MTGPDFRMDRQNATRGTVPLGAVLPRVTACLLLGASVLHLLEVSDHSEIDPVYGRFFLAVAGAQALAAASVVFWRAGLVLYLVIIGNIGVVAFWLWTRIAGLPIGAQAGVRQAFELADGSAAALEAGAVLGAAYLLWAPAGAVMAYPASVAFILAGLVAPPALIGLTALRAREACLHFNPEYGPLGTVDGHSLLPRDNPRARMLEGETKSLLSGLVVNCGSEPVTITSVEVVSESGDKARVIETSVVPAPGDVGLGGGEGPPVVSVEVPPTGDRPTLALYSRVTGVAGGFYSINGLRIRYRYQGRSLDQVFATNVALEISGAP